MRESNPLVKNEADGMHGKRRERGMEMKRQRFPIRERLPLSVADEVCMGTGK